MRIGIVGLGLMGGSLALALRRALPHVELIGTDADDSTLRLAVARGVVSAGDPRDADVVVVAAPIPAFPDILAGLAGGRGLVTDVASTKTAVMRWAAAAGVDLIGGHPMCGLERSGLDAADADLFQGAPWVLTRDARPVTELVRAVGAVPVVMDAERHDRLVAGVSHAAFVVSAAYVLALAGDADWPAMQRVAGSGFRDVSRLAGGDPGLYSAIASTNRERIVESLRAIEAALATMRGHLEAGDGRLFELFEVARLARQRWATAAAAPVNSHAPGGDA